MWVVIKFNRNELNLLRKDFLSKLGKEAKFFLPKLKFQKLINNRFIFTESLLLGDYLICFHPSFKNLSTLNTLKYCKGIKYFLNDYYNSQKEINDFIKKCEEHQDEKGYIKQSFFDFKTKSYFKFISGPFTNIIFKILAKTENRIKILVKNHKLTVLNNKYLFKPV